MELNRVVSEKKSEAVTSSSKKKRIVNPKRFITFIVIVVFSVYFIYTVIWQQVLLSKNAQEIDRLEEKITAAEQQKEKLQAELDNLNDPEYLEKVARDKLGMVRPNERVFVDANQSDENHSN